MTKETNKSNFSISGGIESIISGIQKDREKEIINRRFGLYERKETLEQIGELLGITRERVRQLEKSILDKLRDEAKKGSIPQVKVFDNLVTEYLKNEGGVSRISNLTAVLKDSPERIDQSRVAFLVELSPNLTLMADDDNYFLSVTSSSHNIKKDVKDKVEKIIEIIKTINKPEKIEVITKQVGDPDVKHIEALAKISKNISELNGYWGLTKWPTVNPKNIRDKIYVILKDNGKHMHFNEIAEAIRKSDFKRNDVTTQAIHNELIKDKRFVLIGRGIYALKEWGYSKGTVSDIIATVLKEASTPLHKDEIVKKVLENRFVKETTVLLNLQGKPQFKRVSKATYELVED